MKIILNPMFEEVSGQLGDVVFREVRGKTVASRKATVSGLPSDGQAAHRERFKQAVAFGKAVLADETTRQLYQETAERRNVPLFSLTIADFFNEPTITKIDTSTYSGKVGDVIKVHAGDDFGLAQVHVNIASPYGDPVEHGNALELAPGSGLWIYTATQAIASPFTVNVKVVATDRPGGSAVLTVTHEG